MTPKQYIARIILTVFCVAAGILLIVGLWKDGMLIPVIVLAFIGLLGVIFFWALANY